MFNNQTIVITGGTGSFGRFLTSYLFSKTKVKKIIIYSRDEWKQWKMEHDFADEKDRLQFVVGDVREERALERAFQDVDVVLHAAALKQVPACEDNPFQAVQTNIIGSQNVIEAAIAAEVPKVVGLITDKSVRPINLYGGTKLVAERLFVHANSYRGVKTKFSCGRWGNIVGTRGSVVPLFLEQKKSGKLTVTDPDMTRFFITLPQISDLFWQWIEKMDGGEIFVPKSPSVKIMDLAKAIAGKDTKIEIVGKRIGEKLHEDLIAENEIPRTYDMGNYYVIAPEYDWWNKKSLPKNRLVKRIDHLASNTVEKYLNAKEINKILSDLDLDKSRGKYYW